MSVLLKILRAAHCRSTHHFFAIDALPLVQTEAGIRLKRLLLAHHHRYLTGAIDPDIRYRDFQNHVIHANDGYWGGAPRVAHSWYDRIQRYLRTDRFGDAAHAAGVLSHYFTDVMQPLHTAICSREMVLHRPIECSIRESYQAICRAWKEDEMRIVFQLSDRPGWLGEAMLHGARFAHRKRELLLDGYAIDVAAENPRDALSGHGRAALSEMFGLAITGVARVFERAASEAESNRARPLPKVSLVMPALIAGIEAPLRRWYRMRAAVKERKATCLLLDEFRRTGTLKEHLPAEVDITHRVVSVWHDEKRWKKQRQERLRSRLTIVDVDKSPAEPPLQQEAGMPATIPFVRAAAGRGSLSADRPLQESPSIGPKTAARFADIQIHNVDEFLSLSPQIIAQRLHTYWITAETVRQWQAQAMLMCHIPGLRVSDTQLLAGSGYSSADEVAACDVDTMHANVSRFALTTSGRRYLRGTPPPSRTDVSRWIADAADESFQPQRRSA